MTVEDDFIDYYDILQVDPSCDAKTLEIAYRHLAKMYHPDHPETTDVEKFNAVITAYKILRNSDQRAEYDILYADIKKIDGFQFSPVIDIESDEKSAFRDAEDHAKILLFLYKRRREHAQDPGVARYFVQEMLKCSDEHFDFHVWYLKAKGFLEITEQGALAITIQGVDHVITMSRTTMKEKLRIAQLRHPED